MDSRREANGAFRSPAQRPVGRAGEFEPIEPCGASDACAPSEAGPALDAGAADAPAAPTAHVVPAVLDESLTSADAPISRRRADDRASGLRIVRTLLTLTTALVLAFTFRAFMMEPFIIPTGSMAPGLRGDHLSALCANCGWEFDVGLARDASPAGEPLLPPRVVCPNCQFDVDTPTDSPPPLTHGDRILVHKWPFELGGWLGPRRWDVIVFRDPGNPTQNYIKRLVGLPGEEIEIVGGDVFINGRIARKTPASQSVLWTVVYDQAYLPHEPSRNGVWAGWSPVDSGQPPAWTRTDARLIRFASADGAEHALRFTASGPHAFGEDMAGYNGESSGTCVRDVRIRTELAWGRGHGWLRCTLRRGAREFSARIGPTLGAELTWPGGSRSTADGVSSLAASRPTRVEFGHLDHRVYLLLDGRDVLVTSDSEYAPDLAAQRGESGRECVEIEIAAANAELTLRCPRIERDVYYTYRAGVTRRAYAGESFRLGSDEFFVLGDNSAASHDSREWYESGPHLPPTYRPGTVLRDQIVGRAFLVYLPGLLPSESGGFWRFPDVGRMRVVR